MTSRARLLESPGNSFKSTSTANRQAAEVISIRNTDFDDERRPPNPPLHSEKIVTERKIFFLDLKENDRGKFIKITEDVRGRRDTIILPMEAAQEFLDAMMRTLDAAGVDD